MVYGPRSLVVLMHRAQPAIFELQGFSTFAHRCRYTTENIGKTVAKMLQNYWQKEDQYSLFIIQQKDRRRGGIIRTRIVGRGGSKRKRKGGVFYDQ